MLRTSSLYSLSRELQQNLPSVQGRLRQDLALWVKGTLPAHNGCQDSAVAALAMHGCHETVRRELRAWTCDDADRVVSWGPGTEVDAAACFPELPGWVLALWTPEPEADGTEPSLILVCDPTHPRDEWVALVVSVAYRAQAIPVAWHVVKADAPESWIGHYRRRLRLLAPAVPAGMPVHVLCDRGLDSRDLWDRIVARDWHPVLRHAARITFRPTGGDRVPVRQLGGGPGTLRVGAGEAFGRKPLPGTLIVLHDKDCEEPWVLPANTPPRHTEAALYACRHWIEQGFRGPGGAAGRGAARAAPTPCAWPGTCWSWPWPPSWRSPTAPAANRPAPAACDRAHGAARRPIPNPAPPHRAASACCDRALPVCAASWPATASGPVSG